MSSFLGYIMYHNIILGPHRPTLIYSKMWYQQKINLESSLISEAGYWDTVGDNFDLSTE